MATCTKCGALLSDENVFCFSCGAPVTPSVNNNEAPKKRNCKKGFYIPSLICGIISLIASIFGVLFAFLIGDGGVSAIFSIFLWAYGMAFGFAFAVPGIVLGAIGLKTSSKDAENRSKAKTGLILSVIGAILAFVSIIIMVVVVATSNIDPSVFEIDVSGIIGSIYD